jgi:hypothetical protein
MDMRFCIATGFVVMFAAYMAEATADDALAIEYAQEAVVALKSEFNELKDILSVSSTQLLQLQSDLHHAELTLLQLRNDNAGIARLLQAEIDHQATLFKQQISLAERGVAGEQELAISELRLLIAQCNLARHNHDGAAADVAIRRAIAIETSMLKSILTLASRGVAGRSSIAKQKLRIAQLIATRTITLSTGS